MMVSRRTVAVSKEAARCLETVAADLGAQRTAPGTIERAQARCLVAGAAVWWHPGNH